MNKQKFKGQTLYRKRVVNNILKIYNDQRVKASEDWYADAHKLAERLGSKYNKSVEVVAGVIASLSPLKSWDENKRIAERFLKTGKGYHTQAMQEKARDIMEYRGAGQTEYFMYTLRGNKIQSFFINIAFPNKEYAVTIDRHAIAICLGRSIRENEGVGITDNQYDFFVSCYKDAAQLTGLRPSLMQSITWEKWRELKQLDKFKDVPF